MGEFFNSRTMTAGELLRLPSPVLLCSDRIDFSKAIVDAGYQTISLNLPMAASLAGLPEREIIATITEKIRVLFPQSLPVYMTDYEMLFDPRYELDVIRLFVDLSRRNKLIIKWCGTVDGDVLTYAEHGFVDYKRYKVNDYDVVIVK